MYISFFDDLGGLFLHFSHRSLLRSLGRSSEVKRNPKMSISFYWLQRGGRWGLSPSTSPADHQKLNESKNEHFIFLAGEGWQTGFESIDQPGQSSEVEHNPKMSISFF